MAVLAAAAQRLSRLTFPFVLLIAAFVRFFNLSGQSLWSDEGNSVALARRGLVEIAQRTAFDIHPPLYYWLLKLWIGLWGDSEVGLRSFSAVLGVLCVYLIGWLGIRLFGRRVGLLAALLAALSPFQVYYSQEARMYMLLTLLGTLTIVWAVLIAEQPANLWFKLGYIVTVTAGLYTHYAYPVVWAAAAIAVGYQLVALRSRLSVIGGWIFVQFIPLLFYLPWLPTAWRQVTTWPSEPQVSAWTTALQTVANTLLLGLSWPYAMDWWPVIALVVTLALFLFHQFGSKSSFSQAVETRNKLNFVAILLLLWFFGPVLLTLVVFSPAFLKFLLVAAPALSLLLAVAIVQLARILQPRWLGVLTGSLMLAGLVSVSLLSLFHYYTDDAFARDNYRGIVQFIQSVGKADDAVILNAEGQQDVFGYYFEQEPSSQMPVYPLPQRRPLDEAATLTALEQIAAEANKIYAVYWATQQADPEAVIEGWLDNRLFKATDQWFGNVRLVSYASAAPDLPYEAVDYRWENGIRLTGLALSNAPIVPGDIIQVGLQWQTESVLDANYTVFLQVLDANNHLVGQRDAWPLTPTPMWPVDELVPDGHGIYIEPGTPPGTHRLIMGLYHSETGQRLRLGGNDAAQDFVVLGDVAVGRSNVPLPAGAFTIQQRVDITQHGMRLVGYDLYKLGYRSTPETPLRSGEPLQLVVYWSLAASNSPVQDELHIEVIDNLGQSIGEPLVRPLAGVDYPAAQWQPGEIVRAQYSFPLAVEPGSYRLRLSVPGQDGEPPFETTTQSFRVE
ncbi:MAG: glycosyltransferase family 39 protein [Anaerolineae bacterium]|nr:glycosyltransferase family 39 protein [Anaerolineae bacterium]